METVYSLPLPMHFSGKQVDMGLTAVLFCISLLPTRRVMQSRNPHLSILRQMHEPAGIFPAHICEHTYWQYFFLLGGEFRHELVTRWGQGD